MANYFLVEENKIVMRTRNEMCEGSGVSLHALLKVQKLNDMSKSTRAFPDRAVSGISGDKVQQLLCMPVLLGISGKS